MSESPEPVRPPSQPESAAKIKSEVQATTRDFMAVLGTPSDFNPRSSADWAAEARRLGWKRLWVFAFLALFVILTRSIIILIIGLGVAWLIRRHSLRIDQTLAPIWPVRNVLPMRARRILGWVLPVVVALLLTLSTTAQRVLGTLLGWIPLVGFDGSIMIFVTLIAALVAYIFMREPQYALRRKP